LRGQEKSAFPLGKQGGRRRYQSNPEEGVKINMKKLIPQSKSLCKKVLLVAERFYPLNEIAKI